MSRARSLAHAALALWSAPVPALPVALFRVATALLTCAYLVRLYAEAPLLHGPSGLVAQEVVERAFPFTWQPLFRAEMPLWVNRAILATGAALCIPLAVGLWPRRLALVLYAVVVCATRSHFAIASVDDGIVHLLLFWCVLLPSGASLAPGVGVARTRTVPGGVVRAATWNFALIYAVAGIAKWTSPMWRDGSALHAVLSLRPAFWSEHLHNVPEGGWRVASHAALLAESLFPLLVVLRPRSRAKLALGAIWFAFHLALVATFDVALGNLGCLALGILCFRDELAPRTGPRRESTRPQPTAWVAAAVVALLVGAMATSLARSGWRNGEVEHPDSALHESPVALAFYGPLWAIGLMQQYRLLDWIDDRNHVVTFRTAVGGGPARAIDDRWLTPRTMRGTLLLAPLVGSRWSPMPEGAANELRARLRARLAARLAPRFHEGQVVTVDALVDRVQLGRVSEPTLHHIVTFAVGPDGRAKVAPPRGSSRCAAFSQ